MRPQEILGMVEEASGTRMFEERKDKAKKTMGKKEKRVEQITALLNEEITPKLDSLRAKKKSYLQYQKSCSELEKMVRVISAWDWLDSTKFAERKAGEITARASEKSKVERAKERHIQERDAAEEEREAVSAQRERELKKGGKAKKLEEDVTRFDMELVKLKTQIELKESSVAGETKRVSEHEKDRQNVSIRDFPSPSSTQWNLRLPSFAKTLTRSAMRFNVKRKSSTRSKMNTTSFSKH